MQRLWKFILRRRKKKRKRKKLTVSSSSSSFSASKAVGTGLTAIASAVDGGFAKWSLHFLTILLGPAPETLDPGTSSYCTERPSLIPGLALSASTCAMLVGRRKGLPFASASCSGAEEWVCETLPTRVGAVRGRARVVRPVVSSITVTSVTGSEMSVRADEPSGAETMRRVARESRGWRTALLGAVVDDGPGSAVCVSLVALSSNCRGFISSRATRGRRLDVPLDPRRAVSRR